MKSGAVAVVPALSVIVSVTPPRVAGRGSEAAADVVAAKPVPKPAAIEFGATAGNQLPADTLVIVFCPEPPEVPNWSIITAPDAVPVMPLSITRLCVMPSDVAVSVAVALPLPRTTRGDPGPSPPGH